MFSSFSTALSALNATSTAIDVVGNNLANLNTTGYKDVETSFQDLMTQAGFSGNSSQQIGMGTAPPLTIREFSQGSIETSTGAYDCAIQGNGFFVVQDTSGAQEYTRAGNFQLDANGNLITATGDNVQGWTAANGVLNTSGAISGIQLPIGKIQQPSASTQFSLDVNLNAAAANGSTNATFSTPVQLIDSLGNPINATVTFTKDATTPLQWDYQVSVPGNATTGGTPGTPTNLLSTPGVLTFDANGNLTSPAATAGLVPITIAGLSDNAADLTVNWNLYNNDGSSKITQFSQASAVSATTEDGMQAGQFTGVSIGDGGQITAKYSNGNSIVLGQVAMAAIVNPQSLVAVGNNNYITTASTGAPTIGTANTGGRGQILGGSLEQSTVDISTEFTNLITLQRAYDANSKVVTTTDQLTQDTVNLMR
ncbi:conserved exported hypothetical protein [Candidatus Sulfopaludibacter sp. SbA3]|nr:conserved exported hypothetical protein [Candidatus Sulfopaludibacter sp. SbA3]